MTDRKSETHRLGIAGIVVVSRPDTIRTVLGSCVGIAMYDRAAGVGGMAHIILPSSDGGMGARGKFADTAVDQLLEDLIREGGRRTRLESKIAGGASMFGPKVDYSLGDRNVHAVRRRLAHHSIALLAEDVGGNSGRRMVLSPSTGRVEVQIIGEDVKVL